MSNQLDRLLSIMARLRDPQTGCEWDRAQDFATIAPYTIEEAYEVADAIERERHARRCATNSATCCCRWCSMRGWLKKPVISISPTSRDRSRTRWKRGTRTSSATSRESPGWEDLKAEERAARGAQSALDGVARALPALMRAEKLQKRAARAGFDWPDAIGPAEKLAEEMIELAEAEPSKQVEEAGDLLFAAVNLVRAYGIAPEDALRAANAKFERRFRAMEDAAGGQQTFAGLSLDEQEALWQQVKRGEPELGS